MIKNNMETEKSLLRLTFSNTYKMCKASGADDDRMLFVRMIDNLMEALNAMENVTNTMIKLAFHPAFDSEFEQIENLETSLKERGMI